LIIKLVFLIFTLSLQIIWMSIESVQSEMEHMNLAEN